MTDKPICSACRLPIDDLTHTTINGLHYHSNHTPLLDRERLTATEWSEREHERRVKMARVISFIMLGTEERYPDWMQCADFFINQLRHELGRVLGGRK